jgi:hypothetical protein
MTRLILLAVAGIAGCSTTAPQTEAVPCIALARDVADLRAGLIAHPETDAAVGLPGARLVKGAEAVCQ